MPFYEASKFDVLFTQTASVTVANTTTETTLVGAGVGSMTIPANLMVIGRTLRIVARGFLSTKASPAGNITFRVRIGGISGGIHLASAASDPGASLSNVGWKIEGILTWRTIGASGTVFSQGERTIYTSASAEEVFAMVNAATVTQDTTINDLVVVSVEWATADAGNTCTCTNLMLEVLS